MVHILCRKAGNRIAFFVCTLFVVLLPYIAMADAKQVYSPMFAGNSVQADELSAEQDYVKLYDGATGEIEANMENVPDLYFTPAEDGAWELLLTTQEADEVQYICFAYCELYEKQSNNSWELIDWINEQRGYPSVFGYRRRDVIVPQYFQKGKTYKIHFEPTDSWGPIPAKYQYSFQKTDDAGCHEGWIWRIERSAAFCVRYMGDESILTVPEKINNYPVKHVEMDKYSSTKAQVQIIIAGESVCRMNQFSQCKNLKDIYIYNKDCDLEDYWLPKILDQQTGEYYCDTITHSYAGGNVEKVCLERNYPFVALLPTPTPQATVTPSDTPFPTANPTETPEVSPSQHPTNMPAPTVIALPATTPTKNPTIAPSPTVIPTVPSPTAAPSPTTELEPMQTLPPTAPTQTLSSATTPPPHSSQTPAVISGFKLSTDNYTMVRLNWKPLSGISYQVCRSTSLSSGFRIIKKGTTKTSYQDRAVQSGKCYYYRIQAVKRGSGGQEVLAQSKTISVKIRALARPVITVKKKQTNGIRFLQLRVTKYQGKRLEVYYRNSKWASYRKVRLNSNLIKRKKRTFRIQYLSTKKNLYLKMRTYKIKRGKKIYSIYTKEKRIRV